MMEFEGISAALSVLLSRLVYFHKCATTTMRVTCPGRLYYMLFGKIKNASWFATAFTTSHTSATAYTTWTVNFHVEIVVHQEQNQLTYCGTCLKLV